MSKTLLALGLVLGLVGACAPAPSGDDPTTTTQSTTTEPTTTTTVATTTTTEPTTTEPTTTEPTSTTTTEVGDEEGTVVVYFFMTGEPAGPYLVPVAREIEPTEAVGRAAMELLLAGPSEDEAAGTPALSSAVPERTELLGLEVADGLATVDLSVAFESGGGSFSVLGRLAQVVYTLTRFPTVDRVAFFLEGEPVEVFSGEGVVLEEPQTRGGYRDFLPAVFVDRPAWGGQADAPLRLVGMAEVPEFSVTITDWDGRIIAEETVRLDGSEGEFVPFDVTIPYRVEDDDRRGALIVATPDRQNVREYPIWLDES